jgi:zinc D-Ala-D-Ala dipeptidase
VRAASLSAVAALCLLPNLSFAAELPAGFVRLADIDPTIRQDIRYAGAENFLGRKVDGYLAPVCILTEPAARALASVQKKLAAENLSLVVFDCYRPARAVADLLEFSQTPGPSDPKWFPAIRRERLVAENYVGVQSGHSRGSTADLAIVDPSAGSTAEPPCGAAATGMLDMGTGFDCFDPASATEHPGVSEPARRNRRKLLDLMTRAGFRNFRGEWWHFSLRDEPFAKKRFDFDVE